MLRLIILGVIGFTKVILGNCPIDSLCLPADEIPPPGDLDALTKMVANTPKTYSSFPIFNEIVIQNFHFITNKPLLVELHDAFCTGNFYQVYDNFQLIETGKSILNFCGISSKILNPTIRNPTFSTFSFEMHAGEHYFTVVIFHSPIGSQKTSMWITLKPMPGSDDLDASIIGMDTNRFPAPCLDFTSEQFKLADYVQKPSNFA